MKLREVVLLLQRFEPKTRVLSCGFTNPHPYRLDHDQLAFSPATNVTVGELFELARLASRFHIDGVFFTADAWCRIDGPYDLDVVFQELFDELEEMPDLRLSNQAKRVTHMAAARYLL